MKTQMMAIATVAALALAAPAAAQSTANQGYDMLTGALFNAFTSMGIETDQLGELSLSQIAQIKDVLDGDVSDGNKKARIEAILDQ